MNVLCIAGNLTKDGELRRTPAGKEVLGFSVAVSKNRDEPATFFDCSLWGDRAAKLQPYIRKGDKITVMGEVSAREHNGKAYLQVFVRELTLQGGKRDSSAAQSDGYGSGQASYGGGFGAGDTIEDDIGDSIPF